MSGSAHGIRRLAAGVACGGLLACSGPPIRSPEEILQRRSPVDLALADFPGAGRILRGYDPLEDADPRQTGESVLFGLELQRAGKAQRWLLLVEAHEPLRPYQRPLPPVEVLHDQGARSVPQMKCPMTVRLYDVQGKFLQSSRVRMPWAALQRGLVTSCLLARQVGEKGFTAVEYGGRSLGEQQVRSEIIRGFHTLTAFLRLVRNNDLLASILWKVVDKPSLFSVLIHGGVRLKISAKLAFAQPVTHEVETSNGKLSRRAFRIPLQILVNGTPALDLVLLASDVQSPFRIHGGIVALSGIRPTNEKTRIRLRVLAARRIANR